MSPKLKSALQWLRRYMSLPTICVVATLVYMIFFSDTTIVKSMEYRSTIDSLRNEISIQTDSLEYYRRLNDRLQRDPQMLERVVREHYNMKRADEDIYIFEPADSDKK
ncbi:MAG: septum formation initiator family protein [Muribaculaceae bacterium]